MKVKQSKTIRIKDNRNIFSYRSIGKKSISFFIFLSALILSTILLLKIKDIPENINKLPSVFINFTYVGYIWLASTIAIRNISYSIKSKYISYVFGLLIMIYIYIATLYYVDYHINGWWNITYKAIWILPIISTNIIWKYIIAITERKIRPYFSNSEFYKNTSKLTFYSAIGISYYMVDKYLFHNNKFNYIETFTFLLLIIAGLLVITSFISAIMQIKYSKFLTAEKEAIRYTHFLSPLLHVIPTLIWMLVTITGSKLNLSTIIYIVLCGIIVLLLFMTVISRKEAGGSSKIYIAFSSSAIMLIILGLFIIDTWFPTDFKSASISMAFGLLLIFVLNAIVAPKINSLSMFLMNIISGFTGVLLIIIWILIKFFGNGAFDLVKLIPFNINTMIELIPLVFSVILCLITTSSLFISSQNISRIATRINKIPNIKKKVKKGAIYA